MVVVALLSGLWDVFVTIMMSVSGSFILEVLFVVVSQIILPSCRL
jgi:hypothetical protein